MPLSLPSLNFALICDGNELETHDAKQEGQTIRAFVASEAGKQFRITVGNNLSDTDLRVELYIDGECTNTGHIEAGQQGQILGIRKSATSILPFKFQELELVDPDLENAPVVQEMGMIELRAFRCQVLRTTKYTSEKKSRLHKGRVSERSKMAGWHHVSTGDEVPAKAPPYSARLNEIDPPNAPHAIVKVVYRPRELLIAQGVIAGCGVGAKISGGSGVNDRKRAREAGSAGPSKRRTGSTVKNEEFSDDDREKRIQSLQAELNSLMAAKSGSTVKRELRSPSPIVVGQAAGEVVNLTIED